MASDTNVEHLVVNKMTQAQYDSATKSPNELYLTPDNSDYSTTEQDTGCKWIDGKKIYRKVLTRANPTSTSITINHGITNISKVIKMDYFIHNGSNATYSPDNTVYPFRITNVSGTAVAFVGNSGFNNWTLYIILEYTKA